MDSAITAQEPTTAAANIGQQPPASNPAAMPIAAARAAMPVVAARAAVVEQHEATARHTWAVAVAVTICAILASVLLPQ